MNLRKLAGVGAVVQTPANYLFDPYHGGLAIRESKNWKAGLQLGLVLRHIAPV